MSTTLTMVYLKQQSRDHIKCDDLLLCLYIANLNMNLPLTYYFTLCILHSYHDHSFHLKRTFSTNDEDCLSSGVKNHSLVYKWMQFVTYSSEPCMSHVCADAPLPHLTNVDYCPPGGDIREAGRKSQSSASSVTVSALTLALFPSAAPLHHIVHAVFLLVHRLVPNPRLDPAYSLYSLDAQKQVFHIFIIFCSLF